MNRKFLAGLLGVCFVATIALPGIAGQRVVKRGLKLRLNGAKQTAQAAANDVCSPSLGCNIKQDGELVYFDCCSYGSGPVHVSDGGTFLKTAGSSLDDPNGSYIHLRPGAQIPSN